MPKISNANRKARAFRVIQLIESLKSSRSGSGYQTTKITTQKDKVQAATGQSKDISPNFEGQKKPRLRLSQLKSVIQLRIAQAILDELEDQESLLFVNFYLLPKTPGLEKAQLSTQVYDTPKSS